MRSCCPYIAHDGKNVTHDVAVQRHVLHFQYVVAKRLRVLDGSLSTTWMPLGCLCIRTWGSIGQQSCRLLYIRALGVANVPIAIELDNRARQLGRSPSQEVDLSLFAQLAIARRIASIAHLVVKECCNVLLIQCEIHRRAHRCRE